MGVQATMDRLGVFVRITLAKTLVQGSQQQYESGMSDGGDWEGGKLWIAMRQQSAYMPQLHALPWAFAQKNTCKQQEDSLMLHAEKKALAGLLACSVPELNVAIEFNACIDCHEFFKEVSLLLSDMIQLRQPKMVHTFADGCCSCNDQW